jgi:hypothetical protein
MTQKRYLPKHQIRFIIAAPASCPDVLDDDVL